MIVIAPHSTRAACYIVLLTSNTKRRASFLVRRHSETHLLKSSLLPVTSYSSMTIRVSACIFPNFRQWKKDFTVIKFSRECHNFFINHINCLNSEKKTKSRFRFICILSINIHIGDADHVAFLIETHSLSKAERLTLLKVVASVCKAVERKKGFINSITSSVNASFCSVWDFYNQANVSLKYSCIFLTWAPSASS